MNIFFFLLCTELCYVVLSLYAKTHAHFKWEKSYDTILQFTTGDMTRLYPTIKKQFLLVFTFNFVFRLVFVCLHIIW